MADRPLKIHELRKILNRIGGIVEDASKGKGSHTVFIQTKADGRKEVYTIPTSKKDISSVYISGIRKRYGLREQDGMSDKEFYGK